MRWHLVLLMSIIASLMLVDAFPSLGLGRRTRIGARDIDQNSSSTETARLRASPIVWLRAGTLRRGSEINLKVRITEVRYHGGSETRFWHREVTDCSTSWPAHTKPSTGAKQDEWYSWVARCRIISEV
ncbi:hypothetical protein F5146DRAFT_1072749 [Armillaria mellea]|nr:hypothetical protein F5146DRAFT_1072749 [Armillaria mellea]